MPVFSAIRDIVTDRRPFWVTRSAVVSKIASRTAARCASIVSFHSLGTTPVYTTTLPKQYDLIMTHCLDKMPLL
jgi:hypothetical protein